MVAGYPPFPEQASLYDHIRNAPVRKGQVEQQNVHDVALDTFYQPVRIDDPPTVMGDCELATATRVPFL
jgi:hypothetical protein